MARTAECHDGLYEHELARAAIGAFHAVYDTLGCGFTEVVYSNALVRELRVRGFAVATDVVTDVRYRAEVVGSVRAGIVVESRIVVEVRAGPRPSRANGEQLLSYLRAAELRTGLLLHFGPRPAVRRIAAMHDDPRIPGSRRVACVPAGLPMTAASPPPVSFIPPARPLRDAPAPAVAEAGPVTS